MRRVERPVDAHVALADYADEYQRLIVRSSGI
jgi:hypothetical protein